MKRFLCVHILLMLVALGVSAEKIFDDLPGSYAIYHDTRFSDDVYLGVAYVGEDTLLARSFETKTGNEIVLLIPFVQGNDGGFDMGPNLKLLKGDFKSSPAASRVIPMLLNWGTTWLKSKGKIADLLTFEANTDDDYVYQYWIPVFQLERIVDHDDGFALVTAGILEGNQDPRFFTFNGLPEVMKSDSFQISAGTANSPIIDGLKIPLDNNWKSTDGRVFRIQVKTDQDAAFFVETINIVEQGIKSETALAKLMILSNKQTILLANGTRVFRANGQINLFLRILDQNNLKASIQQSQLVARDAEFVSIVSLASFESLYNDNKVYFDRIIY